MTEKTVHKRGMPSNLLMPERSNCLLLFYELLQWTFTSKITLFQVLEETLQKINGRKTIPTTLISDRSCVQFPLWILTSRKFFHAERKRTMTKKRSSFSLSIDYTLFSQHIIILHLATDILNRKWTKKGWRSRDECHKKLDSANQKINFSIVKLWFSYNLLPDSWKISFHFAKEW